MTHQAAPSDAATSAISKNSYTDAPDLQPNLLLGSFHLLFWLFFHPAAWRNYLARLDPSLRPDFSLAELTRAHWQRPLLRRLLWRVYIVWPLLLTLALGLIGVVSPYRSPFGAATGLIFALVLCLVINLTGGLTVSVALGLVGSIAGTLAASLAGALSDGPAEIALLVILGGLALGVAASVASSVSGVAPGSRETYTRPHASIPWQMSGIVLGVLIGLVGSVAVGSLVISLAESLTFSQARATVFTVSGGQTINPVNSLVFGLEGAAAVGIAVGWRTQRRWGLICGLAFGLVLGLARLTAVSGQMLHLASAVHAAWVAALFALCYALAERVAGPWAGTVAGALGSGGVFFLSIIGAYPRWPIVPIGVVFILLGLTIGSWRPVLSYPFMLAWNLLLRQAEERRPSQPPLLRRHSAFWDEHQLLPLPGLVEHLVLTATRHPADGQAAIEYLTTSHQRWAARAAQIELDARRLEQYPDAAAIGQAHRHLAAGELAGPASALLRSFNRISQDVDAALRQESAYNCRLALSAIEERLDGLLRELTRSTEPYAVRFRPIATHWRQRVADHIRLLAEAVEHRQEIDSPYIIGLPLTEQQEIFVGRTDISARIEQLLLDRRRPPLLLYGQRRMGKTSLLNNLGRLLPSTVTPLFVDLQGAARASEHAGLLYNLARDMSRSARQRRNLTLPPLAREALATDPFTCFEEWLDDIEQTLTQQGQQTALLALDEFEALDNALSKGRFIEEDVLGMLRHLIQHRPYFKVLVAGSHTLEEFQQWAGYLINVQVVHLSYLGQAEAYQLIERPVQDFALRYEPEASRRVLALTRGHPFLVQLLCAEIVTLKNEQEPALRRLAISADVEKAAAAALQSGSFFFADIERNQVDPIGLAVLRFLAAHGEGASLTPEVLAPHFPDNLDRTLDLLTRRELIEATDEGYGFQVELIRRWFA